MLTSQFTLPIHIDLVATFLFGLIGGRAALKRGYDVIGRLALQFKLEATQAALIAIGATIVFRVLAIRFNWTSRSLWQEPPPPPPAT